MIPKGWVVLLLKDDIWLLADTRLGEPKACQAVEDKRLIEIPSSIIVWCIFFENTSTTI